MRKLRSLPAPRPPARLVSDTAEHAKPDLLEHERLLGAKKMPDNTRLPRRVPMLASLNEMALEIGAAFALSTFAGLGAMGVLMADMIEARVLSAGVCVASLAVAIATIVIGSRRLIRRLKVYRTGYATWGVVTHVTSTVRVREEYSGRLNKRNLGSDVFFDVEYAYLDKDGAIQAAVETIPQSAAKVTDDALELVILDPNPPHKPYFADELIEGLKPDPSGGARGYIGWRAPVCVAGAILISVLLAYLVKQGIDGKERQREQAAESERNRPWRREELFSNTELAVIKNPESAAIMSLHGIHPSRAELITIKDSRQLPTGTQSSTLRESRGADALTLAGQVCEALEYGPRTAAVKPATRYTHAVFFKRKDSTVAIYLDLENYNAFIVAESPGKVREYSSDAKRSTFVESWDNLEKLVR